MDPGWRSPHGHHGPPPTCRRPPLSQWPPSTVTDLCASLVPPWQMATATSTSLQAAVTADTIPHPPPPPHHRRPHPRAPTARWPASAPRSWPMTPLPLHYRHLLYTAALLHRVQPPCHCRPMRPHLGLLADGGHDIMGPPTWVAMDPEEVLGDRLTLPVPAMP